MTPIILETKAYLLELGIVVCFGKSLTECEKSFFFPQSGSA